MLKLEWELPGWCLAVAALVASTDPLLGNQLENNPRHHSLLHAKKWDEFPGTNTLLFKTGLAPQIL